MADLAVLEELGPGRALVRVVGGPHDGEELVVVDRPDDTRLRPVSWYLDGAAVDGDRHRALQGPAARAEELLVSLLTDQQRDQWHHRRTFEVVTPYGSVELGRLFHLRFRRSDGVRFVLCVVPRTRGGVRELPEPDVWANLLLVLGDDPERFFRVANWYRVGETEWHQGHVPVGAPLSPPAPVAGSPVLTGAD